MKTWKILVFAGLTLLLVGLFSPLVVLQIETLPSIPTDGGIYTELPVVQIVTPVTSTEYASSVEWYLDGSNTPLTLALTEDMPDHRTFSAATGGTPSLGSHTYRFKITWHRISDSYEWNEQINGSFIITTSGTLTGKWYINDMEVTSPDQIVTLHINTVTFRFMKTSAEPPDADVTCTVSGLPSSLTLPNTATTIWEGTVDVPNGSYILTLTASTSSSGSVTMALYSFTMFGSDGGDGGLTLNFGYVSVAGLTCIGIGLFLKLKRRKE